MRLGLGVDPARFIPRLILALALCLPLWIVLTPAYNRALAIGLTLTLPLVGEGGRTGMAWKDYVVVTPPRSGERQSPPRVEGFRGYLGHFNAPLLVALFLATPGLSLSERLKALVSAGLILYALHLMYLILELKHLPYVTGDKAIGSGWGYRWGVELYLVVAAQLSPILLWLIFLRYHDHRKQANPQSLPQGKPGTTQPDTRPSDRRMVT